MKISRQISPIISTDWLANNIENAGLIVIDIRAGRNTRPDISPVQSMFLSHSGLLPETTFSWNYQIGLSFKNIGNSGINPGSLIIIVNKTDNPYHLADVNRVAITLIYAGCLNASILDGGYDKWVRENRPVFYNPVTPETVEYSDDVDKAMFVSKDYVRGKIGKSVILDTRDPDVYFGLDPRTTHSSIRTYPDSKVFAGSLGLD